MTGPRRRAPHATHGLTVATWPPRESTPPTPPPTPPRPSSSTVRRRPRNADAVTRQPSGAPRVDGFVQIPTEVLLDRDLDPSDVIVWAWFAMQRAMWNGARGPLNLKRAAAELARTERNIRYSVTRLEARGHVTVTRAHGLPSTYSLPWLSIHKLGRRMAIVND